MVLDHASLHVVLASTHSFDKSLVETVVQNNENPTDGVERSTLLIASTISNTPVADLIVESAEQRVRGHSSHLF